MNEQDAPPPQGSSGGRSAALAGICIVEIAIYIAGPSIGIPLANYGVRVIKIERTITR